MAPNIWKILKERELAGIQAQHARAVGFAQECTTSVINLLSKDSGFSLLSRLLRGCELVESEGMRAQDILHEMHRITNDATRRDAARLGKSGPARVGVELITLRLVALTSSYGKLRATRDSCVATIGVRPSSLSRIDNYQCCCDTIPESST